jgi:hypothetical protein
MTGKGILENARIKPIPQIEFGNRTQNLELKFSQNFLSVDYGITIPHTSDIFPALL